MRTPQFNPVFKRHRCRWTELPSFSACATARGQGAEGPRGGSLGRAPEKARSRLQRLPRVSGGLQLTGGRIQEEFAPGKPPDWLHQGTLQQRVARTALQSKPEVPPPAEVSRSQHRISHSPPEPTKGRRVSHSPAEPRNDVLFNQLNKTWTFSTRWFPLHPLLTEGKNPTPASAP